MAINSGVQNLINSNKKLSSTDANNLFFYFYGRPASTAELSYWGDNGNKTSSQLEAALKPNANQFTNARYYKDVISTPTPTQPQNSNSTIHNLYQKYLGKPASANDLNYWKNKPTQELETKLKANYENPVSGTGHPYDGTPIVENQQYTLKDKERIDAEFAKYGFDAPKTEDYNYWSNPNKTNHIGDFESNLKERYKKVNDIPYGAEKLSPPELRALQEKGITDDQLTNKGGDIYLNNPESGAFADIYQEVKQTKTEPEKDKTEVPEQPSDQRVTAVTDPEKYNGAFFNNEERGTFVTFQNDPDGAGPLTVNTIYHVDPKTKNILPIDSEVAYEANFEGTLGELLASGEVTSVPMDWTREGYPLYGYTVHGAEYSIKANPSETKTPPTLKGDDIPLRYGKPVDKLAHEDVFRENVAGFLKWVKENPDSGISSTTIDEITKDPNALALYTNALTYGGYTQADIYRDLKKSELVKQGRTDLAGMEVISPTAEASQFYTGDNASIRNNPLFALPDTIGGLDAKGLENKVLDLRTEYTDAFTPIMDWQSAEGKAKIDEIQSAYHDILLQYMEAKSETEQALAEQSFNEFNQKLQKNFNINVGNNALEAWDNVNQLGTAMTQSGLTGSGKEKEALDKYLQRVRRQDTALRDEKLTTEENAKKEYYQKYATTDQVNALSEEEKIKFGLKPSTSVNKEQWTADFKKQYPNEPVESADMYYNLLYDKNGNYRSELSETDIKNRFLIDKGTSFGSIPVGKEQYKKDIAQEKYLENVKKQGEDTARQYKKVQQSEGTPYGETKPETLVLNNSISGDSAINVAKAGTIKAKNPVTGVVFDVPESEFNSGVYKDWTKA